MQGALSRQSLETPTTQPPTDQLPAVETPAVCTPAIQTPAGMESYISLQKPDIPLKFPLSSFKLGKTLDPPVGLTG